MTEADIIASPWRMPETGVPIYGTIWLDRLLGIVGYYCPETRVCWTGGANAIFREHITIPRDAWDAIPAECEWFVWRDYQAGIAYIATMEACRTSDLWEYWANKRGNRIGIPITTFKAVDRSGNVSWCEAPA